MIEMKKAILISKKPLKIVAYSSGYVCVPPQVCLFDEPTALKVIEELKIKKYSLIPKYEASKLSTKTKIEFLEIRDIDHWNKL